MFHRDKSALWSNRNSKCDLTMRRLAFHRAAPQVWETFLIQYGGLGRTTSCALNNQCHQRLCWCSDSKQAVCQTPRPCQVLALGPRLINERCLDGHFPNVLCHERERLLVMSRTSAGTYAPQIFRQTKNTRGYPTEFEVKKLAVGSAPIKWMELCLFSSKVGTQTAGIIG